LFAPELGGKKHLKRKKKLEGVSFREKAGILVILFKFKFTMSGLLQNRGARKRTKTIFKKLVQKFENS